LRGAEVPCPTIGAISSPEELTLESTYLSG
jgi:hypothetical protein